MTIALWACHICEKKFHTEDGGLCRECHKPTCRIHLGRTLFSAFDKNLTCEKCRAEAKKARS
jgi:hypothetical protein